MTTTEHPLTEAAAAEMWDASRDPGCPLMDRYEEMRHGEWATVEAAMRAAFDAGREHARTTPAEVTDEMVLAALNKFMDDEMTGLDGFFEDEPGRMRAALSAALAVATPTDPHHDPRPWQDCTRGDIRKGDLVEARIRNPPVVGVAYHQDGGGDWWTAEGNLLTCGDYWPLRRIPAPTPPAVEVEMPGEPCVLTDVRLRDALATGVALWTGREAVVAGFDGRAVTHPASDITAFTLPDGTRARRDGERENGEPRFVKAQEGEK